MRKHPGEWALITGASRGLGRAFAEECAKMGYDLLLVSLPDEGLGRLGARISETWAVRCRIMEADLAETEAGERVLALAETETDRLALLVNNAGIGRYGAFGEASFTFHRSVVELNIQSTMGLTYALLPLLARGAPSRILTVASLAAFQPMPLFATYAASKAFLKSWGMALAEELGPLGIGSTVLAPGGIYTSEQVRAQARSQGLAGYLSTQEPEKVARIALERAERGQVLVVPGIFNRLVAFVSGLVPDRIKARAVYGQWKRALARAGAEGAGRSL